MMVCALAFWFSCSIARRQQGVRRDVAEVPRALPPQRHGARRSKLTANRLIGVVFRALAGNVNTTQGQLALNGFGLCSEPRVDLALHPGRPRREGVYAGVAAVAKAGSDALGFEIKAALSPCALRLVDEPTAGTDTRANMC